MKLSHYILIAMMFIQFFANWILNEAHLSEQAQLKKEASRAWDSLAKCNGVIKINQFKWPNER